MFDTALGFLELKKPQLDRLKTLVGGKYEIAGFGATKEGEILVSTKIEIDEIGKQEIIASLLNLSEEPTDKDKDKEDFKLSPLFGLSPEEAKEWATGKDQVEVNLTLLEAVQILARLNDLSPVDKKVKLK